MYYICVPKARFTTCGLRLALAEDASMLIDTRCGACSAVVVEVDSVFIRITVWVVVVIRHVALGAIEDLLCI